MNLIIFGKAWSRQDPTWLWLQSLQEEGIKHIGVAGPLNFLPIFRFLPKYKEIINFILDGKEKTHDLYKKLIKQQEELLDKSTYLENLIQMFLKEKKSREGTYSYEEFYNQQQFCHFLADIFGAGLDTTLVTLRWFLLYISTKEDIQKRIQEEIDCVLQKKLVSLDDMQNLPLVEAAIAETQRIRSVVPLGIPHSNSCDIELEGYKIPKNTMIIPLQWAVHMNQEKWKNPEEFDPFRFLDEEGRFYKPGDFLPFQSGKRMCIGDEFARMILFLFGTSILQKFEISLVDKVDFVGENGITLNPKPHKLVFRFRDEV